MKKERSRVENRLLPRQPRESRSMNYFLLRAMPGEKQGLISCRACTLGRINLKNVCENGRHRIVPLACVSSLF